MDNIYDVIIIGGGPAGLSAAIYAGRSKLKALVIEGENEGGQIVGTAEIANYPGCLEGESGQSLIARMIEQAESFGAEFARANVRRVGFDANPKIILAGDKYYFAKTVIIATGAHPSKIGCPGEEKFIGQGISYCATCDGPFYEGLQVFVVGGGDAAVEEAIYLTNFASDVYIIHRRDQLRAAKSIQEKAFANLKIKMLWSCVLEEIKGEDTIESIVIKNLPLNKSVEVRAPFGLFSFVGFTPNTSLFEGMLKMDNGYIITDDKMQTSIKGVFAAGDVRKKSLRQVVTAAADGAIAATSALEYLQE